MFLESSLSDLYDSAVRAFPRTTLRQHATQPIVITEIRWTPFIGTNVLFTKGLAESGEKVYNPIIAFKKVNYDGDDVVITASTGVEHSFEKLSQENTDVMVGCNCLDFKWRFNFYNSLDKSLYGRKRTKYESKGVGPSANPKELPGMCKHLLKLAEALYEAGIMT